MSHDIECPNCGSDDVIPYDDGHMCRDCGDEFYGDNRDKKSNLGNSEEIIDYNNPSTKF